VFRLRKKEITEISELLEVTPPTVTTNWVKVGLPPPATMMFTHYYTSPECNKFIWNTRLYIREKRREINGEQKRIDKDERI
jgi:hypothetical protein